MLTSKAAILSFERACLTERVASTTPNGEQHQHHLARYAVRETFHSGCTTKYCKHAAAYLLSIAPAVGTDRSLA